MYSKAITFLGFHYSINSSNINENGFKKEKVEERNVFNTKRSLFRIL